MEMVPYIGVTGIRTPEEAVSTANVFEKNGLRLDAEHVGMIGVLTAAAEDYRNPAVTARSVGSTEDIAPIFEAVRGRVLPMLHIEINKQPGESPFAPGVSRILRESGVYDHGLCQHVQLNGFPSIKETKALRAEFPNLHLVFQIRRELIEAGGDEVLRILDAHQDSFSSALIDPSAGTGTPFDMNQAVLLYRKISPRRPDLLLGFAGGFTPENTKERVLQLRKITGNMHWSIDVEGGVRELVTDWLDVRRVESYVTAACEGFDF